MPTADKQRKRASLSRDQIQDLLDRLDEAICDAGDVEHRRGPRRAYRSVDVLVQLLNARQEVDSEYRVATRNLSAGGLAFLHRQVLSAGRQLFIVIPLLHGQSLHIVAEVIRCRHVDGMMHEIGVKFLNAQVAP